MTRSVQSQANPTMLKWARRKAGLGVVDVAHAESVDELTVQQWENGEASPSLAKLRRLAARYKYPMMTFYLAGPPQGFSPVKDFRTLRNGQVAEFSPQLRYAIRLTQERQAWAADHLEREGSSPVSLINSVTRKDSIVSVAEKIRKATGVTISMQSTTEKPAQAFSLWRQKIEAAGIFVFQSQGIALEEMRGFALPDKFAPVAVINSKDSGTAKSFTLIHEVAHLLLGESAITGSSIESTIAGSRGSERFCNLVAAETLMPEVDFRGRVPNEWDQNDDAILNALAKTYHVSRATVAIRMVELGFADRDYLQRVFAFLSGKSPNEEKKEKAIPQYRLAISRNGEYFSRLAVSAFHAGDIHGGELSSLLHMKLNYLAKLESKILPERIQTFL